MELVFCITFMCVKFTLFVKHIRDVDLCIRLMKYIRNCKHEVIIKDVWWPIGIMQCGCSSTLKSKQVLVEILCSHGGKILMLVFWVVTLCGLVLRHQRFEGPSVLKIEAVYSSTR
jgi:hypothetical protein